MNCNVIKDLLPLYVDDCCSEESVRLVTEHIKECADCKKAYDMMTKSCKSCECTKKTESGFKRISEWKASLIQSVMLFLSFALITLGVILEGKTPLGVENGLWAVALIVPSTGYLLSMAQWFFVRMFKSRKSFSNASLVTTATFVLLGYLWAFLHYSGSITLLSPLVITGVALSGVFCVLSKVLSSRYALLLGRD
ncbi:MAG: zf-HC2 domain-containing protein [Ruminococcus sp.]|nr:zf-HC2 domain-containing protein [Ruminococcus sp.]